MIRSRLRRVTASRMSSTGFAVLDLGLDESKPIDFFFDALVGMAFERLTTFFIPASITSDFSPEHQIHTAFARLKAPLNGQAN